MKNQIKPAICVRVSVCVPTHKRPESLARLLDSLERQKLSPDQKVEWETVLVDNDPEGSAHSVYEQYAAHDKIQLRYVHEKNEGITFARNAAIEAVVNNSDFLCFIDDDETASEIWLNELLKVQRRMDSLCVHGHVDYSVPNDTPLWIQRSGFFSKSIIRDGESTRSFGTGNILISCDFLKRTGLRFDGRFNVIGGEDEFFFYLARKKYGLQVIGAERAMTTEHVPAERITLLWLLKRRFRVGIGLMRCEMLGGGGFLPVFSRAVKGAGRVFLGSALILVGVFAGKHVMAKGAYMLAYGIGVFAGLIGITYSEYAGKPKISWRATEA